MWNVKQCPIWREIASNAFWPDDISKLSWWGTPKLPAHHAAGLKVTTWETVAYLPGKWHLMWFAYKQVLGKKPKPRTPCIFVKLHHVKRETMAYLPGKWRLRHFAYIKNKWENPQTPCTPCSIFVKLQHVKQWPICREIASKTSCVSKLS
jgi:hypothetical protein